MDCIHCEHFDTNVFVCASGFCPYKENCEHEFVSAPSKYEIKL